MPDFTYTKSSALRRFWWKADNEKGAHEDVIAAFRYLKMNQTMRRERLLRNLRMYGNMPHLGLTSSTYHRFEASKQNDRLSLNVVKTMVDTMANRISKNKPIPTFLTEGGAWDQQLKAKALQKFIKGIFYELDIYELGQKIFVDSELFGDGIVKVFRAGNKIEVERCFPSEIMVDEEESFYGHPRQIFQEKVVPREVLLENYPDHAAAIMSAGQIDFERTSGVSFDSQSLSDSVSIVEAWHLPSGPNANDGRHIIAIEGATILDESYERTKFPFVFLKYSPPPLGFWATGLVDELVGLQVEINKILRTIQKAMHLLSIPKVFIEASSKIVKSHFNNEIGGMITYSGVKPTIEAISSVSPELFNHLDRLYSRAFEITGISQLNAQGLKPQGLNSGKAMRTYNDIQTERFILNGQRYENFFLDISDHVVDLSKEISEDDPSFGVMAVGKRQVEKIKWKEVDLDRDKFSMKMFPTSALSETPSARLAEVQELAQAGFIEKEVAIQLLDFPDLENVYNDLTAQSELMDKVIDGLLGRGRPKFIAPDPIMGLAFGIRRLRNAYLRAKINDVDQERLSLMVKWISQAQSMIDASMPQQMPALPGANPESAPRSDLLPVNTPQAMAQVI